MLAREAADQVRVEGLGEAGVGHRRAEALGAEILGRHQAFLQTRTEIQDGNLGALANDPALADFQRRALRRQLDADALAARIAEGRRPVVDCGGRRHHVHQFQLVGRRHDDEVRQASEIGHVEGTRMGGAVGADQSRPIDGEPHRQLLQGNVVHDLVESALQEGRIDRGERLEALGRQAGGEGDAVLLGDRHVESALGEALGELVQAGARRHRRGHRHDLLVGLRLRDQRLGEDRGVLRRVGGSAWTACR